MKKKYFFAFLRTQLYFFLLLFSCNTVFAQLKGQQLIDSLLHELPKEKTDSIKVYIYTDLIYQYNSSNPDKGLKYEQEVLALARKVNSKPQLAYVYGALGTSYWRIGDFPMALQMHFESLKLFDELGEKYAVDAANTASSIGQDYADNAKYPEALKYFERALLQYEKNNKKDDQGRIYLLLSWVYQYQGLYGESSKMNFKALKIYEALGSKYEIALATTNLAQDYLSLGNYTEVLKYFKQAQIPFREINDMDNLAGNFCSIGKTYMIMRNFPEAISNYMEALKIGKSINNFTVKGGAYFGLGEVYEYNGKLDSALNNYLYSADAFRSNSNKIQLQLVCNKIGKCYTRKKQLKEARVYFDESLALAKDQDSKVAYADYYGSVEILDSTIGDWRSAYFNFKNYISNHDSIFTKESSQKIMQNQLQYEFDKKESEAKVEQEKKDIRQRNVRNSIVLGLIGALIFGVVVFRQRNKISKEKKRSEELLLNILPAETAEELKRTGSTTAKDFDSVTVLFTDFKNFTNMSEKLSAQELVNEINFCYCAFDTIITKHNIEKIKTIGDSYMCAGGLPIENKTNAEDVVRAAIEIRDFMQEEKQKRAAANLPYFEIRIGCNTGPVVAGIVGIKKFAYDIWGDTVNIASRMESSGEPGKVNVSGTTYELVKDKFTFTHRGKIEAKNKGLVEMYFVES